MLGVYFNEFRGTDGMVTQMKIAHLDPEAGLDEGWDGHFVETMTVNAEQVKTVQGQVRDVPGLYDLNIRRVAAKTKSGGDAARLQVASMEFVAPVKLQIAAPVKG